MNGDASNVTQAKITQVKLYDERLEYVTGWRSRLKGKGPGVIACQDIHLTFVRTGIRLDVTFEENDKWQIIFYNGKFFITREDSGNDQTRR